MFIYSKVGEEKGYALKLLNPYPLILNPIPTNSICVPSLRKLNLSSVVNPTACTARDSNHASRPTQARNL